MNYPYLTQDVKDMEPTKESVEKDRTEPFQYIKNMQDGSTAGYKYFNLNDLKTIGVEIRGNAEGTVEIKTSPDAGKIGEINIGISGQEWKTYSGNVHAENGTHALYFIFHGKGNFDFRRFTLA